MWEKKIRTELEPYFPFLHFPFWWISSSPPPLCESTCRDTTRRRIAPRPPVPASAPPGRRAVRDGSGQSSPSRPRCLPVSILRLPARAPDVWPPPAHLSPVPACLRLRRDALA